MMFLMGSKIFSLRLCAYFFILCFLCLCGPVIAETGEMSETDEITGRNETAETDEIAEGNEITETDEITGINTIDTIDGIDDVYEDLYEMDETDEIIVYGESFIPLDKDGFVYILADIKKMRPLFDLIPVKELKSWQAALVIDKTEIAVAALFSSDTGRFFQIVGFGSYPSFIANLGLFMHRNWKYMFANKNYYYSNADRLSVRFSRGEIYVVCWRRTQVSPVPEEPGVKMPEGFNAFRHRSGESAPLSLWMENNDSMISRIFDNEGISVNIPIEKLFINLYHVENNTFKADLMLRINSLFSWRNFSINALPRRASSTLKTLFLANPPVQKGANIEFQSGPLSEEDVASLMRIFLRYWR